MADKPPVLGNESVQAQPAPWLPVIAFGASLLALNSALTFGNRWPGLGITWQGLLSVELAGLLLVLLVSARASPGAAAVLRTLASIWLLAWVVLRYLIVTIPALLGRPVNLYWDGRHGWQVLRMGASEGLSATMVLASVSAVVAVIVLFVILRSCVKALQSGLQYRLLRHIALWFGLASLTVWLTQTDTTADLRAHFSQPVGSELSRQLFLLQHALSTDRSERTLSASPDFGQDLDRLKGKDVLLIFLEAYGAISFDSPSMAAAFRQPRTELVRTVADRGWFMVSARIGAPTFGGASWLSHAALLSGVDTRQPDHYAVLLSSKRPTLVGHFARHGYRTIAWMPGFQRPWPEGSFYGFERYADLHGIGYRGLPVGYWIVPDQAAMALLHDQELGVEHPRSPRFVVFPTLSTHAPFRPVPPFVEDWPRLLGTQAYTAEQVQDALAIKGDWAQATEAYLESFGYAFAWLNDYFKNLANENPMIILIGDHQPIGSVTGPGAPWEVPIHVITDDLALAQRFLSQGFVEGVEPPEVKLADMHQLTGLLLSVFSAQESADRSKEAITSPGIE